VVLLLLLAHISSGSGATAAAGAYIEWECCYCCCCWLTGTGLTPCTPIYTLYRVGVLLLLLLVNYTTFALDWKRHRIRGGCLQAPPPLANLLIFRSPLPPTEAAGKKLEIVFVSSDKDLAAFEGKLACLPACLPTCLLT
jgi:hypothetical protein